jgi:hypothetical protein
MLRKLVLVAGVLAAGALFQYFVRRRNRQRPESAQVSRWDDEGGAPDPAERVDTPDVRPADR